MTLFSLIKCKFLDRPLKDVFDSNLKSIYNFKMGHIYIYTEKIISEARKEQKNVKQYEPEFLEVVERRERQIFVVQSGTEV